MTTEGAAVPPARPPLAAHDPRHKAEADVVDKGLEHDSVGLLAAVAMSVSSVAPAYALTATLGLTVTEVGLQTPAIFLVGFVPMLLVAYAYRDLNKAVPDAGTSFTWTVKAFGPHVGWMCGWGMVIAIIIVLSNLAGVAVTFLYLFLAEVLGDPDIATWGDTKAVNVATCLAFVAAATYVAYRGMTTTKGVTYVLVAIQMVALALFAIMALVEGDERRRRRRPSTSSGPGSARCRSSRSRSSPPRCPCRSSCTGAGTPACRPTRRPSGSERTPGLAAVLSLLVLGSTYVLVAVAARDVRRHRLRGRGPGQPGHVRQRLRAPWPTR